MKLKFEKPRKKYKHSQRYAIKHLNDKGKKKLLKLVGDVKIKKPLNKIKKTTLSKAKAKAWKAFSLYIKKLYEIRDVVINEPTGQIECYTCGSFYPIEKIQTGHGIGGRNNSILFEEKLCRPQCVICNVFKRGRYATFTYKLIKELGLEEYERLVEQSQQVVKYRISDYEGIEARYKRCLEEL